MILLFLLIKLCLLQAHPDLLQAFQAAAIARGAGTSGAAANNSFTNAGANESLPRGRGVDERAAKAAAEMRKKAAARGLSIRPHGVPVQAMPPLNQLLNIINSTPDATNNETPNDSTGEGGQVANGHTSNGVPETEVGDNSRPVQQDQGPVGLGSGLAALDSKKPKTKSKPAAA